MIDKRGWVDALRLAVLVGLIAWPLVVFLAVVAVTGVWAWRAGW